MSNAKEVILLTAGDPASISTEITIKAISKAFTSANSTNEANSDDNS